MFIKKNTIWGKMKKTTYAWITLQLFKSSIIFRFHRYIYGQLLLSQSNYKIFRQKLYDHPDSYMTQYVSHGSTSSKPNLVKIILVVMISCNFAGVLRHSLK